MARVVAGATRPNRLISDHYQSSPDPFLYVQVGDVVDMHCKNSGTVLKDYRVCGFSIHDDGDWLIWTYKVYGDMKVHDPAVDELRPSRREDISFMRMKDLTKVVKVNSERDKLKQVITDLQAELDKAQAKLKEMS